MRALAAAFNTIGTLVLLAGVGICGQSAYSMWQASTLPGAENQQELFRTGVNIGVAGLLVATVLAPILFLCGGFAKSLAVHHDANRV